MSLYISLAFIIMVIAGTLRTIFSVLALLPEPDGADAGKSDAMAYKYIRTVTDGIIFAAGTIGVYYLLKDSSDKLLITVSVLVVFLCIVFLNFFFGDCLAEVISEKAEKLQSNFHFWSQAVYFLSAPALKLGTFLSGKVSENLGLEQRRFIRHKVNTNTEIILETTDSEIQEIEADEKEMLTSVIDFNKNVVKKVMIPRNEMNCISCDAGLKELLDTIKATGHSRIPIYSEDVDHIIGIIHAKAVLEYLCDSEKEFVIKKLLKNVMFVPETKEAHELLNEFREKGEHMAIVTDEYGGTSGLITVEDLLEEIVGDIADEYDKTEKSKSKKLGGRLLVEASKAIDEINDEYELNLPLSDEYNSIAGLVLEYHGDIPEKGKIVNVDNYEIKVAEVKDGKILSVEIKTGNTYV